MFCAVYKFEVKEGQSEKFIKGWEGLTKLIYQYEGSLGSRLHLEHRNNYIAYAQWPNKETWKNSGKKLPAEAFTFRELMKDSCVSITTSHELDVVSDLLSTVPLP